MLINIQKVLRWPGKDPHLKNNVLGHLKKYHAPTFCTCLSRTFTEELTKAASNYKWFAVYRACGNLLKELDAASHLQGAVSHFIPFFLLVFFALARKYVEVNVKFL